MKKGKTFFPDLHEEESEEVINVQVADMAWQLHSVEVWMFQYICSVGLHRTL